MKNWEKDQILEHEAVPTDVHHLTTLLEAELGDDPDDEPSVVSISRYENESDFWRYVFVLQLAPGVLLAANYGSPTGLVQGWEKEGDFDDAVHWIMSGVQACRRYGTSLMKDFVHEARVRCRRVLAESEHVSLVDRFVDIRVAPYDQWATPDKPALQLLLQGLDERLKPTQDNLLVQHLRGVDRELEIWIDDTHRRLGKQAMLAAHGADGIIDQIALNAILSHFDDASPTLRCFGGTDILWLPDDTALSMSNGRVSAGNGDPGVDWQWSGDHVTVFSATLPETILTASINRPITEVLGHPFLSAEMIVLEADSQTDDDRSSVSFKVSQPRRHFCTISGHHW